MDAAPANKSDGAHDGSATKPGQTDPDKRDSKQTNKERDDVQVHHTAEPFALGEAIDDSHTAAESSAPNEEDGSTEYSGDDQTPVKPHIAETHAMEAGPSERKKSKMPVGPNVADDIGPDEDDHGKPCDAETPAPNNQNGPLKRRESKFVEDVDRNEADDASDPAAELPTPNEEAGPSKRKESKDSSASRPSFEIDKDLKLAERRKRDNDGRDRDTVLAEHRAESDDDSSGCCTVLKNMSSPATSFIKRICTSGPRVDFDPEVGVKEYDNALINGDPPAGILDSPVIDKALQRGGRLPSEEERKAALVEKNKNSSFDRKKSNGNLSSEGQANPRGLGSLVNSVDELARRQHQRGESSNIQGDGASSSDSPATEESLTDQASASSPQAGQASLQPSTSQVTSPPSIQGGQATQDSPVNQENLPPSNQAETGDENVRPVDPANNRKAQGFNGGYLPSDYMVNAMTQIKFDQDPAIAIRSLHSPSVFPDDLHNLHLPQEAVSFMTPSEVRLDGEADLQDASIIASEDSGYVSESGSANTSEDSDSDADSEASQANIIEDTEQGPLHIGAPFSFLWNHFMESLDEFGDQWLSDSDDTASSMEAQCSEPLPQKSQDSEESSNRSESSVDQFTNSDLEMGISLRPHIFENVLFGGTLREAYSAHCMTEDMSPCPGKLMAANSLRLPSTEPMNSQAEGLSDTYASIELNGGFERVSPLCRSDPWTNTATGKHQMNKATDPWQPSRQSRGTQTDLSLWQPLYPVLKGSDIGFDELHELQVYSVTPSIGHAEVNKALGLQHNPRMRSGSISSVSSLHSTVTAINHSDNIAMSSDSNQSFDGCSSSDEWPSGYYKPLDNGYGSDSDQSLGLAEEPALFMCSSPPLPQQGRRNSSGLPIVTTFPPPPGNASSPPASVHQSSSSSPPLLQQRPSNSTGLSVITTFPPPPGNVSSPQASIHPSSSSGGSSGGSSGSSSSALSPLEQNSHGWLPRMTKSQASVGLTGGGRNAVFHSGRNEAMRHNFRKRSKSPPKSPAKQPQYRLQPGLSALANHDAKKIVIHQRGQMQGGNRPLMGHVWSPWPHWSPPRSDNDRSPPSSDPSEPGDESTSEPWNALRSDGQGRPIVHMGGTAIVSKVSLKDCEKTRDAKTGKFEGKGCSWWT